MSMIDPTKQEQQIRELSLCDGFGDDSAPLSPEEAVICQAGLAEFAAGTLMGSDAAKQELLDEKTPEETEATRKMRGRMFTDRHMTTP